jgi:hypothetical protein
MPNGRAEKEAGVVKLDERGRRNRQILTRVSGAERVSELISSPGPEQGVNRLKIRSSRKRLADSMWIWRSDFIALPARRVQI